MGKKTKKKKVAQKPRLRRFSPLEQQHIKAVASALGKLMPATSQGNFCLAKMAKKINLKKYYSGIGNKQKQYEHFVTQVFGRHKIKFKSFVNDILAEAIEWRRSKGNPVLRPEADVLKVSLTALGVDLRKEIDELQLPIERPRITPPPINVSNALGQFGLHPSLLVKVLPLFKDGHLNEAVRKSGEIFEARIKRRGPEKTFGRDLAFKVFNKDAPLIDIAGYHNSNTLNQNDEREGFMYLAGGAMHWCKNVVGHDDIDQLAPNDAASRIIFVSHLLDVVDKQAASTTEDEENSLTETTDVVEGGGSA